MSESRDRFEGRAKHLSSKELSELRKEWKPKARQSYYKDFLDRFLKGSSSGLNLVHITTGELAGFLGMVYPAKHGQKAPFTGKIAIQTKKETEKGKKPVLYTVLLTKKAKRE